MNTTASPVQLLQSSLEGHRVGRRFRQQLLLVGMVLLALMVALGGWPGSVIAADPPLLTSVAPGSGPAAGGTTVTITGANFQDGATVTFNGVSATDVAVASPTSITAVTPAGAVGSATLVVTNPDSLGASLGGAFVYFGAPPTVTSVSPATGSALGGTAVTVTGTGLASGATVRFGGTLATGVTVVNGTTITATTPAGAVGAVTVMVTNSDTQSGSLASGFTYQAAPPPTVAVVTPASGTTGGGTAVTVTGTGFSSGATVRFGNTLATGVTVVNSTTITATTPAGSAGAVAVRVTNTDSQSGQLNNAYTYVSTAAPTVTSLTPTSGALSGGNPVVISGTGFLAGATVTFGSTNASSVTVTSATQLSVIAPAGAAVGPVNVRVTNTDGKSATLTSGYTYTGTLTVTGVTPNNGTTGGGTPVTITGTGFLPGATVRFQNTNATSVTWVSATQLTAVTPSRSASTVSVTVINPGNVSQTLNNAYTYVSTAAPTVTGISPNSGPLAGGNTVTITGTGFLPGATVRLATTQATGVTVVSPQLLTAVVPARSTEGAVSVSVTNTDGKSSQISNAYTYLAAPTITGVAPNSGTTAGGTDVVITGTNFSVGSTTVTFGGLPAVQVTVTSSTSLTARTPARAAGAVNVVVQSLNGQVTLNNGFTYQTPAQVHSISPVSGPTVGGTSVTINGSGFAAGATVRFGGALALNVVVVSSNTITAATPARAAGATTVEVRSAQGIVATGTPTYTYITTSGSVVGGSIPTSGLGLFVYSGGTTEQLVSLAVSSGCPFNRISFYATISGKFVVYVPAAPGVVNAEWNLNFASGLPANTPLLARCS